MPQRLMADHRIATVCGIEIRVAYFLYIFIALIIAFGAKGPGSESRRAMIACVLLLYPFLSFAHELAHALAARRYGVTVSKILLHPIGGAAELRGLLPGPGAEIVIALAGPLLSLTLAGLLYPGLCMEGYRDPVAAINSPDLVASVVAAAILVNLAIGVFNLLPIFPMDGGRVATALAVMVLGPKRGIRIMSRVAAVGVALLIIAGAFVATYHDVRAGLALGLIGTFLFTIGRQEMQARVHVAHFMPRKRKIKPEPPTGEPSLDASAPVCENGGEGPSVEEMPGSAPDACGDDDEEPETA